MKPTHLLLFVFLCMAGPVCSQQAKLDSLLKVNQEYSRQDEKKLQLLIDLADTYKWMQFDTGLMFADEAIRLATKLNNQKLLALGYDYKAGYLFQLGKLIEAQELYHMALDKQTAIGDSLGKAFTYIALAPLLPGDEMLTMSEKGLKLYEKIGDLPGIGWSYSNIGYYYNGKNLALSLEYNNKAQDIFRSAKNDVGISSALLNICMSYSFTSEYEKALQYSIQAKEVSSKAEIRYVMLTSDWMTGYCYQMTANYPKALEYTIEAQKMADRMGSRLSQAALLVNLGYLYIKLKNFGEAKKYFDHALVLAKAMTYKENMTNAFSGLGTVYLHQGNLSEALQQFQKAMELSQEMKNETLIADSDANLAEVYLKQGDYDLALEHCKKVMDFNRNVNDSEIDSRVYLLYAKVILAAPDDVLRRVGYHPAQRDEYSKSNLLKCISIAKESGELDFHRDALKELSGIYERMGNGKLAFDSYKQYSVLNDSILNTDKFNSMANLQLQYETEKNDQEITLLKSQREVDRLQAARRLGINFGLSGALLGIVFVAGAFYRQSKKTKRINTDLEKTNRELKDTQQQLVKSEKMAAFGMMATRMAHEILNPLNFVNNFSEVSSELIQEMVESGDVEAIKETAKSLQENIDRINYHGKRADLIIKELQERTRAGTAHEYFEGKDA